MLEAGARGRTTDSPLLDCSVELELQRTLLLMTISNKKGPHLLLDLSPAALLLR